MYEEVRWANKEDIKQNFSEIKLEEFSSDISGITVCYDDKSYFIDPSNRNTILYGCIRADVENYFTLPLLDSIMRADESFVLMDKDWRIMEKLGFSSSPSKYNVIQIRANDEESLEILKNSMDRKVACFIQVNKNAIDDGKSLAKVYDVLQKNDRINYIINNFAEMPRVINLEELMAEVKIQNSRFYFMGVDDKRMRDTYGKDYDVIKNKFENFIFQNSKDIEFLELFSELCGYSYDTGIKKQLIYMPELYRLKENEAVFLCGNICPIKQSVMLWQHLKSYREDIIMRELALQKMEIEFANIRSKMQAIEVKSESIYEKEV